MFEAVVGGLIGAVFTAFLGLVVWTWNARGRVAEHDRLIRERDEDLDTWLADEDVWLTRVRRTIDNQLAARGILDSGERGWQHGMAAETVLHRWRDQERQARRYLDELKGRERWPHHFWRSRDHRPFPQLATPGRAGRLLELWQALAPDDPTVRMLDATIMKLDEEAQARDSNLEAEI